MAVYVDDMEAPFGRGMVMCHMIADSSDELFAMADRIGVQRRWVQYGGTWREHFDIAKGKRKKALAAKAIEITWMEYGRLVFARRKEPGVPLATLLARLRARGDEQITMEEL